MSTFVTSRGTRGQHVSPKFQSAPYRPSPARREHIYGRIQPLDEPLVSFGRRLPIRVFCLAVAASTVLIFGAQMLRVVLR